MITRKAYIEEYWARNKYYPNFVPNKHISQYALNDTIYISKTINGFNTTYLCKFVSYNKGIVIGKIITQITNPKFHYENERKIADENDWDEGKILKARPTSCFVVSDEDVSCCKWFKEGVAK